MASATVVPGASSLMRVQVRRFDGSLAVLDGATITSTILASGVPEEAVSQVIAPDSQTRIFVISAAQTAARAGKQIRLRAFIAPAGGYETVASEAIINVAA